MLNTLSKVIVKVPVCLFFFFETIINVIPSISTKPKSLRISKSKSVWYSIQIERRVKAMQTKSRRRRESIKKKNVQQIASHL